ncbi:hypothetical protein Glove_106g49 [Diversispora epigaea]|uniref:Uncharacterized protein n=1 Tax=Diversispora epigaea TaxID=1348612 RepID=A0A397J7C6_9GLOM|nr:hypothetical protein Glove_106g49 [Diversispora epigaea]
MESMECQQDNTGDWCNTCNNKRFQIEFDKWTSGNSSNGFHLLYLKGGFYKETWSDGHIKSLENKLKNYKQIDVIDKATNINFIQYDPKITYPQAKYTNFHSLKPTKPKKVETNIHDRKQKFLMTVLASDLNTSNDLITLEFVIWHSQKIK